MNIIAIVGPAGSGKDTAARILSNLSGIPLICSYTTRPMREGEENGREHWFVKDCNVKHSEMLAYTEYGGYEYWTTIRQVGKCAIYVIDEKGLLELKERFPYITVTSVYIFTSKHVRKRRGVTDQRIKRDESRMSLPFSFFDYRITNNYTLDCLKNNIKVLSFIIKHNVLQKKIS